MAFHKECKESHDVMGDGYCKKHGVYPFYDLCLKEKCSACADEKRICQKCGESLIKVEYKNKVIHLYEHNI